MNLQKTILLIEDHAIFSMIIRRAIEQDTSYRVVYIADGSAIHEVIKANKPHLLVLDYELPGKNGIELYDLIRTIEGYEHIPAIMVSAELPQQEMVQRNILGLQKPCKTTELVQAVKYLLA
ncbi:MAG TPA: response regulator [Ktedonobacteraceae bacterium]|jgi:DNA-binding response OmpR family regulator